MLSRVILICFLVSTRRSWEALVTSYKSEEQQWQCRIAQCWVVSRRLNHDSQVGVKQRIRKHQNCMASNDIHAWNLIPRVNGRSITRMQLQVMRICLSYFHNSLQRKRHCGKLHLDLKHIPDFSLRKSGAAFQKRCHWKATMILQVRHSSTMMQHELNVKGFTEYYNHY